MLKQLLLKAGEKNHDVTGQGKTTLILLGLMIPANLKIKVPIYELGRNKYVNQK